MDSGWLAAIAIVLYFSMLQNCNGTQKVKIVSMPNIDCEVRSE